LLTISQRLEDPRRADVRLELPYELRSRTRFRMHLAGGEEVRVLLPRGQILRGGDRLLAGDGRVVEVAAAAETVSIAHGEDVRLLARAAYHLGNRHTALQIGQGWLRYRHDHVLDHMLQGLGLRVTVERAPFEPETGAYTAARTSGDGDGNIDGHEH